MLRVLFHIAMIVGLTLSTKLGGIAWIAAMITTRGMVPRLFAFAIAFTAISIGALYAAPTFGGAVDRPVALKWYAADMENLNFTQAVNQ